MAAWRFLPILVLKIFHLFVVLTYACQLHFWHYSNRNRGSEWYLEKCGSQKILSGTQNLGSVYDKSQSLIFWWFVFTFLSLKTFFKESRAQISN